MFRRASSQWLLSIMLLALIAAALLLMWVLSSWVLSRTFDEVGRAVVLDDLGEYGVLYERGGVDGVRDLFTSGQHESDQMVKILGPTGEIRLDVPLAGQTNVVWPDLSGVPAGSTEATTWHRHPILGGGTLTVGRRRLSDGSELWFGRTDAADVEAINRVHRLITLTMGIVSLLAVGPVFWFSSRVIRPVRRLIQDAQRVVREDSTLHRLETSVAITELQELAGALNTSLDRVQALKDELEAANDQLAHELRTPLARIRGNAEQILSTAESPEAREAAERAIAELERATRLVQTILSIRAGDARSMKLHTTPVALVTLASETCELYSAAAEEKELRLEFEGTGETRTIIADRERLQQGICNLLDNAIAYTPRGGTIHVQTEFLPNWATLRVVDSGPGLSEVDQASIWRRFVRGSAASAGTPGIGLGLCLVKAVVGAHHGEVGARNRPEGGAEFWMRLPYS